MDAVAPLVHILEEAQRGTLTLKIATETAGTALALLGNVSAHMTCNRRKRVLRDLNKDLLPLKEVFKGAAPLHFGDSFEKKMKEHLESLKCLWQSTAPKSGIDQCFRRGCSHYPARGGGSFRGIGEGQRYNPYHQRGRERHFQKDNVTRKQQQ